MISTKIIRATPEHAKLLSVLGSTTFDQAFRGTCADDDLEGLLKDYYNLEQVSKELKDPEDYFFIFYVGDTAAGYSRINLGRNPEKHFTEKNSIELMRIYFLEDYHGQGLASQLIEYCLDFLRKKGYEQVYLSVWEHNHRAQAFYKKHGFYNTEIENPFPIGDSPQMDYWFAKEL
jgi:ribosomal protein S18 acetylase RimI-like enzyme